MTDKRIPKAYPSMTAEALACTWCAVHCPSASLATQLELAKLLRSIYEPLERDVLALRLALTDSQTWLYGHTNEEGQAARRRLNEALLEQTKDYDGHPDTPRN